MPETSPRPDTPRGTEAASGGETAAELEARTTDAGPPAMESARAGAPRSPRRLILAGWALAGLALLMLLVTTRIAEPTTAARTAGLDRPAPAFDLETLDGARLTFESLRGRPVVVNFWASWCIPCREEAPLLNAAAARYGPAVAFVGALYQDSRESAQRFVAEFRQAYPAVLDPDGRTAIDYAVFGIPETFFIDAAGIIRSRQIGVLREDDLRRQIEAILP